jgi:hypothetical protein
MEMRTDRMSSRIVTAIGRLRPLVCADERLEQTWGGAGTAVQHNASFLALAFVYSLCDFKYRSFVRFLFLTGTLLTNSLNEFLNRL